MHTPPDVLATAIRWLRTHPDLPAELKGSAGSARVSSRDVGAYPCLRIRYGPGGSGGLRWQVNAELTLELLDDLDPTKALGDERQHRTLSRCLWLLAELPDADQPIPGRSEVVTLVLPGVAPSLVPEPGVATQPRWLATASVNAHPAPQAPQQEE